MAHECAARAVVEYGGVAEKMFGQGQDVVAAFGQTAVELIKAGAADYTAKPWDDSKLSATVENLLELS